MLSLATDVSDVSMWVIGGCVAIIWIIAATIQSIIATNSKERSRREIAAYIAEGSMSPEQGERLMNAGESDEEA